MDFTNAKDGKSKDAGIVIVIDNGGKKLKQPKEKYKKRSVKVLSILHIVLGIISCNVGIFELIMQFVANGRRTYINTVGQGIFCGIPFLITGILGLISLTKTSYGKITAFLVFSILSSLFGAILLIMSSLFMAVGDSYYYSPNPGFLVCQSILILIGLLEVIIAIVSSGFSCHGCCGCSEEEQMAHGDSTAIYVPMTGSGSGMKSEERPRIVEINMQELSKQRAVALDEVSFNNANDGDVKKVWTSGKYSQFN